MVNFETLRQLLGGDAVDEDEEMYQFTWPGKQAARREAAVPITDTLLPVPADSVDWDTTEQPLYRGRQPACAETPAAWAIWER